MTEPVLSVTDVVKTFDEGSQKVEVLKGVSIKVAAGEVVALEGPSGSGKTTLLSIMGCILTPTEGKVQVAGRVIRHESPVALREARRRSIGFVFQQFNLFPALTALENVEYALNVKGARGRAAHLEAMRVLEKVALADRLHFLPRDLSGGQKQRVAIARALSGSPQVILADEPTANLDTTVGVQILELFRDLAKGEGTGLVIVTHDPKVRQVSDRVVGIRDGRLIAEFGMSESDRSRTPDSDISKADSPELTEASSRNPHSPKAHGPELTEAVSRSQHS